MQMRGQEKKKKPAQIVESGLEIGPPTTRVALHLSVLFLGRFFSRHLLPSSNPAAKPDTRQLSGAIWRLKPSTGQLAVSQIPSKGPPTPALGPHWWGK